MTARDRNALAVGALVLSCAWLCLRGGPAVARRVQQLEDEVQQRTDLVERGRRETLNLRPLSDSIAHLEQVARSLKRVILMGGEATTATFDLTRRLSEALSRTAAFVEAIEPSPDSAVSGALHRVSVQATLETDVVGLGEILARLDMDSTLAVETLEVTVPSPDGPPDQVERLRVLLGVSAWFVPDTTSAVPTHGEEGA